MRAQQRHTAQKGPHSMQTATHHSTEARKVANGAPFPPLEQVTKPNLTTEELAFYADRQQQTLRIWACRTGSGPLTPLRINGRLAWPVAAVRKLLGVAQ
jgi:hypothetical protein